MEKVDLFVIGAGSGGVRAARIAAGHGAKVAIAEEANFGGTCVNRGCVPKKLLVYASRYQGDFDEAAAFGWRVGETSFDWATLIANKDREIARLESVYRRNLDKAGVTIHAQRAVLDDAHTVRLADGSRVHAGKILIATGGRPYRGPAFEGQELAITSDEAFHLAELPRRIVIVGGGYIAVEFAGIFAGLGSETTLVHRGERLLRGFDTELADELASSYGRKGMGLRLGATVSRIVRDAGGLAVTLSDGSVVHADAVMLCTGRRPYTGGLGLDNAGVALAKSGAILVDAASRTSVPSVFAVGDVTDRVNLTPVAIREGHAFADREFGGVPQPIDYELIPTAVFSTPELGTVGLPEAAARERYPQLKVFRTGFRTMRSAFADGEDRMLMKLLVDGATDRVVGVHVLGDAAAEMIQLAGVALTAGATKAQFDMTMALHPSAAEELVTLRQAS
ncbi:glutathione-disulfide reductase [Jeongeupia chitinilytica]|uniref:Glutathione-disulfide reductase n=1 Tax=Jeongeupia chitinilytica TaxID=1041641 RepID=A0ABQ3H3Q4_9NEIS|nr:glutathione-disulfide reductase [Jeongeupia chitinilytica]GHD68957.1 glutathione-disulfide reductase [Jeongeupia chitinilytica]